MSPVQFCPYLVHYKAEESLLRNVTSDQTPTNHELCEPGAIFFALFQALFAIGAPMWCGWHAQSTIAVFMTTSDMFISFLFVITLVLVVVRSSGTRWHIPVPYAQLCFLLSRCELVTTSTAGLKAADLYPLRWRWCFDLSAVRTYVSKSRYEEDII